MRQAACDAKNKRKLNTIAPYATKKFGIEYQEFLLRFSTHRNEFNCVFRSTKLRQYATLSGAMHNSLLSPIIFSRHKENVSVNGGNCVSELFCSQVRLGFCLVVTITYI